MCTCTHVYYTVLFLHSYVIFHRHGQRAPTKNIYEASHTEPHHAPHLPLAEAKTWQSLLAVPDELEPLQELYPVRRHPDRGLQSDLVWHLHMLLHNPNLA